MLKNALPLVSLLLPMTLLAAPLTPLPNFQAARDAINQGQRLHVVINFEQCTPAQPVSATFTPTAVMYFQQRIVFSDNHLTLNEPDAPGTPIREIVSYTYSNDAKGLGQLTIQSTNLYAATLKKLDKQPPTITCELATGGFKLFS